MALDPGTRIGPYEVKAVVGAGGMGIVYRAHDDRLQRDVAVKLLSEEGRPADATRARQIQQEARAAGQLNHPNIVAVFDVGMHDDAMFVVTELLEGESFRALLERGPVPWRTALGLLKQVAAGLAAAHERGIVHRDIKPDNVFLTRDGLVKILDFGIATRKRPDQKSLTSETAETMSQAGVIMGTIGYMSPEQARGDAVDHRSDAFSFGCLCYELLSGQQAFQGRTALETLVAVQRDTPVSLHERVAGLPDDVVRVVDRCLEKDPARRFQSTADLVFALTLIGTGSGRESARQLGPAADDPASPAPSVQPAPAALTLSRRGVLWLGTAVGAALVADGAASVAAFRALSPPPAPPLFRQVTFQRGTVYTARFSPDGASVAYSAAWEGRPRGLFTTVPNSRDSRSLDQSETDVAYFLPSGELGVIRRSSRGFSRGTLSRLSLAGGPSKDLLDGISWADSAPDGETLTVVRRLPGKSVLELPVGHPVAEAASIVYPRLSPDGARVAYLELAGGGEDTGKLVVVDRAGKRVLESQVWKSIEGVGWHSDAEVWFAASNLGRALWLYAVDLKGKARMLCRAPGRLVLHDTSADGRALAERNSYRSTLVLGTASGERDFSWQDFSQLGQLSADGKQLLFSEQGDGAGAGATAYLRPLSGGPPLRLADGLALALSADAGQALVRVDAPKMRLELVPVGAGRAEPVTTEALSSVSWASFLPGASRALLLGREDKGGERLYLKDLPRGGLRPITDEGVSVAGDALSPDGKLVAATFGGRVVVVTLGGDGAAPRELPGLPRGSQPLAWSTDGKTLFVRGESSLPVQIDRYDLASGRSEPWRTLQPVDPAGVLEIGRISIARDGEVYAYESYRLLSDLYVIDNLA